MADGGQRQASTRRHRHRVDPPHTPPAGAAAVPRGLRERVEERRGGSRRPAAAPAPRPRGSRRGRLAAAKSRRARRRPRFVRPSIQLQLRPCASAGGRGGARRDATSAQQTGAVGAHAWPGDAAARPSDETRAAARGRACPAGGRAVRRRDPGDLVRGREFRSRRPQMHECSAARPPHAVTVGGSQVQLKRCSGRRDGQGSTLGRRAAAWGSSNASVVRPRDKQPGWPRGKKASVARPGFF